MAGGIMQSGTSSNESALDQLTLQMKHEPKAPGSRPHGLSIVSVGHRSRGRDDVESCCL